ncbi:MAG: alkaline phosphatase PhoX [Nitrososphaeraceae archaeon]
MDIFINHELRINNVNEYAKISKITIDKEGRVIFGKLLENGSGEYQALCSTTLVKEDTFANPLLLTNEEHDDGIVIAYDIITETKTEMPWLGLFSHENTIIVPNTHNKTLLITSEDNKLDRSQLYAFISNNSDELLEGNGQLYVLTGEDNNLSSFRDIQKGIQYTGYFEPVSWDWKTQNSSDLENKVQELNAIDFIKLEDIDFNKNDNSIFYIADTGTDEAGDKYKNVRIYEFKLGQLNQTLNTLDRFNVSFSVILDGDSGSDMRNPDNLGTSKKSLMIQEDLSDYNRIDNGVNARILKYGLSTLNLEPVAIIDQ